MSLIKFKNTEIYEINGHSKIRFEGSYSSTDLANEFIERWIPYYECHKCGKGDYCKYTIPYSNQTSKKQDIKCGVAKKALENYVEITFHVLENADKQKQQRYLDSAFHFFNYIYKSEQLNGAIIDDDKLEYWGKYSKFFLTEILSLRDILNDFGKNFKELSEVYEGQSILLVEGETELKFIENLRGDGNTSRASFYIVDCYHGKGNKLPKRIQMLIDDYKLKGYSIYIQGDEDGTGDGSGFDKFKYYVDKEIIEKDNIFQFEHDFESSIPRKILFYILKDLNLIKEESPQEFYDLPNDKSINLILKENYNIDTEQNNLKTKIAKKLGKILFHYDRIQNEEFNDSELFRFIKFIDIIK